MRRAPWRWLLVVALTLALAACVAPPVPPTAQAPTAAAAPAASATPRTPTPAGAVREPPRSPTPTAAPSAARLGFASIPNPFERRRLAAGTPIAQAGMFFMQVATGEVEAWALPGDDGMLTSYSASPDSRWVIALAPYAAYAADRRSGTAFRWGRNNPRLLVARGEHLLFLDDAGWVWVAGLGHPEPVVLPVRPVGTLPAMAPDGQTVAVLDGLTLYLVRLADLACRKVAEVAVPAGGSVESLVLQAERRGEAFTVSAHLPEGTGTTRVTRLWLERYSWQGERLGELTLPSGSCIYSPDRRWMAWGEMLSDAVRTVVVADAGTLAPRFRVVSASLCFGDYGGGDWLADSSAFIVRTSEGYRMVTLDGRLTAAPTLGAPGELQGMTDEPLPAPDRSDLFAIGRRAVVDANSRCLARPALGEVGSDWSYPADLSPWGLDSTEMRFALPHGGHHGYCGEWEDAMPARVEPAPFSPLVLAVGLSANDCVNLRAGPGWRAQVLACLAGGTRLSLAPLAEARQSEGRVYYHSRSVAWADESLWLRVRAPDGQEGWVDATAGAIGWAENASP